MLYLIGLGIWDERDISLKGLDICKRVEKVYCELYTANWGGSLKNLEKLIGKKIEVLERKDLEEDSENFVKGTKNSEIALLIPGDPLTATTHIQLILECKKFGINFKIVHSSSILTAIGKTGLELYKFGRIVTVPKTEKIHKPTSFYDVLEGNQKLSLHTLLLLDRGMGTKEGLNILLEIEKEGGKKILEKDKIVICSKLGSEKEKIVYDRTENLLKINLEPPAVIIIPGKLHFIEKEFLNALTS